MLGVLAALVLLFLIVPRVLHALRTESTDDAYVNSYVTFVAPRVMGQVARVLVDDNNRVKQGDVLVQLDPEPFRVQVAIRQAALDSAQADLAVANANVRAQIGLIRSNRYKLVRSIEDVDNQIAVIRTRAANWEQSKATLVLAQAEFDRAQRLLAGKVVSSEEYDQKKETLDVSRAQVTAGAGKRLAGAGRPRPAGHPARRQEPDRRAARPGPELFLRAGGPGRTAPERRPLGIIPASYDESPKQVIDEFYRRDPSGNLDRIYADLIKNAPAIQQANAGVLSAQRNLDQAKLDLSYCTVVAEIDGVVTRRNVNPGNNVQVGQSLMAIRSLKDIWVDANFKETQLRDLRIGQHVDLELDMYGGKHAFEGRISGFTMGTGSTLALLPAQNATGNFVKVVQRLPVRIDLIGYDPDKLPLFVGLSVEPTVDLRRSPTGTNAGQFLQAAAPDGRRACQPGRPRPDACGGGHAGRPARHRHSRRLAPEMSAAAAALPANAGVATTTSRRTINPWIIALAVVIPTFMEVLDTTIANVALRYIAGGLSAAVTDSEWVLTSYLAANAIVLPISGYLGSKLGRRRYFLLSIAIFTIASGLCGVATSLGQLILFRVLQGLAGGGLQPSSQGILLDTFPPEKQAAAQTVFGLAALVAPILGPTLGGYITDEYSWRWIFYINLPVGALAFLLCYLTVQDPEYLRAARAEGKKHPVRFDSIGLGLLVVALVCWEVLLSKGPGMGLAGRPVRSGADPAAPADHGRGRTVFLGNAASQPGRELPSVARPQFQLRLPDHFLRLRRVVRLQHPAAGMLEALFGYDAFHAGLVLSPAGFLLDHGADHRRTPVGPRHGCALADGLRAGHAGRGQLLAVAPEPGHRARPGGLAARGAGGRTGLRVRAAQRGGVPLHSARLRGGGRGITRPPAQ